MEHWKAFSVMHKVPDRSTQTDIPTRLGSHLSTPAVVAILILAVVGVWGRSVTFDFAWDDRVYIQKLTAIRSLRNIPRMFYDIEAQSANGERSRIFRPLRTLVYAVLFQLGGGKEPKPILFHAANLVWHLAAVLLFYACMLRLFHSEGVAQDQRDERIRFAALIAALGAAIHPLGSEVVCWCKSLDDLLAATFSLAAFLMLLRNVPLRTSYPWALVFYALAVYSKVSALPFLVIAPLVLYFVRRRSFREAALRTVPFAVVAGIYLFHRYGVLGQMGQVAPLSGARFQTIVDTIATVPTYARLFLGMPPFRIDYAWWPRGAPFWSIRVLAGTILVAAATVAAATAFQRHRERTVVVILALGLAWTLAFFLPVSNIVPMMQYIAERFAYLPLFGVMFALGAGISWVAESWWRRTVPLVLFLPLIWVSSAFSRAGVWHDNATLFFNSLDTARTEWVRSNAIRCVLNLPYIAPGFDPFVQPEKVYWQRVDQALALLSDKCSNHPDLLIAKAMAAVRRGRLRETERLLRQVPKEWSVKWSEFYPHRYPMIYLALGWGDYKTAKRYVLRAFRYAPTRRKVIFPAVCYYKAIHDEAGARRLARRRSNPEKTLAVAERFLRELRAAAKSTTSKTSRDSRSHH